VHTDQRVNRAAALQRFLSVMLPSSTHSLDHIAVIRVLASRQLPTTALRRAADIRPWATP